MCRALQWVLSIPGIIDTKWLALYSKPIMRNVFELVTNWRGTHTVALFRAIENIITILFDCIIFIFEYSICNYIQCCF